MEMQPPLNGNTTTCLDFTTFYNVINGKLVSTKVIRHGINLVTKKSNLEVPLLTAADIDTAV
jgi:hypothetical protein